MRRNAGGDYRVFDVLSPAVVSISGLTISNGRTTATGDAGAGAGVRSTGDLTLDRVVVSANNVAVLGGTNASAEGGGIFASGALHLERSTVSGNAISASGATALDSAQGGGVDLAGGMHEIDASTVSGNTVSASGGTSSGAFGGGISSNGTTSVELTTVSGNAVSAAGGSPVARGGGIQGITGLSVTSSTITANRAPSLPADFLPGANVSLVGSNTFRNVIVSDPLGGAPNCGGVTSAGFNLEDGFSCGFTEPSDQSATNPFLDPQLAANGGPTKTHALLSGSLAIDRGNRFGETTDQRGLPRPSDFGAIPNASGSDGSDVGAVEAQDTAAPETTIDKGPKHKTRKRKAKLRFSADEPGSTFECALDKHAFEACEPPVKLKRLKRRKHVFDVRATDLAGNVDRTPAVRKWRVKKRRR